MLLVALARSSMVRRFQPALLCGLLTAAQAGWSAEPIRGRVVRDDLIPPSSPVAVQLTCAGKPVGETKADEQGRFTLPNADDTADDCILSAAAAGYEQDSIPVARLPFDPDIGALALKRAGKWNGYALSTTTLAVTDQSREAFEAAVYALRRGGQEGMAVAEQRFAEAAESDKSFAEAWYQLGRLRLARQDVEAGREAFRRALTADPWYITPYRPLLLLELGEDNWEAVASLSERLLRINPYLADIHYYRGLACLNLGDIGIAAAELNAIETGPEAASFPRRWHLRGLIAEKRGRFEEARAAYRRYLAEDANGEAAGEARQRLAALERR